MNKKAIILFVFAVGILFLLQSDAAFSYVEKKDGKIYIVDHPGERWDVTQAKSIGFKPEKFQCGIHNGKVSWAYRASILKDGFRGSILRIPDGGNGTKTPGNQVA